jgi:hypothetical protein
MGGQGMEVHLLATLMRITQDPPTETLNVMTDNCNFNGQRR